MRTIDQILAGTSETLFPEEAGKKKILITSRGEDGDSPLHVLAWQQDAEGAKQLIAAGADVNAVGDMGYTPLHVAVSQQSVALVKALLAAGARSDVKSEIGGTAREDALKRGGELAELFAQVEV